MKQTRRHSLAFFLSMGVHASAVLWGSFSLGPGFELPKIELEFTEVEFIDPNQIQGDTKEPPPPEPVVSPPTGDNGAEGEGEGPKEGEEKKKESSFGKRRSNVDQLAPTNSTFSMLLATRKVRELPFAAKGIDIMAPLPDFQFIIDGGGFDVLHDFDYLVVASPDIRDVTQTFLAVDSNLPPEELKAGIERSVALHGQTIAWEQRGGREMGNPRPDDPERPDIDPRWFVFLDDSVAIYVREEFLPNILDEEDETGAKTSGNFVANLAKMRRFSAREPRAGMQIVMKDLHAALKRPPKGLPFAFPDGIEMMTEASEEPELVIRLRFLSAADARGAEKFWRRDLGRIIEDDMRLRLFAKWLYELIEVERKGRQLILRGLFTTEQSEQVLELLAGFAAKMLHRTPEEMEEARRMREENWRRRKQGKLPPSVLEEEELGGSEGPSSGEGEAGAEAEAGTAREPEDGEAEAEDGAGEQPVPEDDAPPAATEPPGLAEN